MSEPSGDEMQRLREAGYARLPTLDREAYLPPDGLRFLSREEALAEIATEDEDEAA